MASARKNEGGKEESAEVVREENLGMSAYQDERCRGWFSPAKTKETKVNGEENEDASTSKRANLDGDLQVCDSEPSKDQLLEVRSSGR